MDHKIFIPTYIDVLILFWLVVVVFLLFNFCRINGTKSKHTVKATLAGNRVEAMCFYFLAFLSVLLLVVVVVIFMERGWIFFPLLFTQTLYSMMEPKRMNARWIYRCAAAPDDMKM
jgi:hypothetical protein